MSLRPSIRALFALAVLVALCLCGEAAAHAQAPVDMRAYDEALQEAVEAHRAQRWLEARSLFARAHALYPNARTLRGLGVSAFEAGLYALALRDLEAAMVHPERPLPADLRESVAALIAQLKTQVGVYVFRLQPPDAQLRIDDAEPVLGPGGQVLLDPGPHRAVVSLTGYVPQILEVEAHGGDHSEMFVRLLQPPAPVTASAPGSDQPGTPTLSRAVLTAEGPVLTPALDRANGWPPLRTGALGAGGLGLLSLATTGALYGAARARIRDIAKECDDMPGHVCTEAQAQALKRQHDVPRLEHGMTATLAVGAVLVLAGAVLWVIDLRAHRSQRRSALALRVGL